MKSAGQKLFGGHQVAKVAGRVGEAALSLWLVATITFMLMRFVPGGPFDAEHALSPEIKALIEAKYGLDRPLLEQYGVYMAKLLTGDLGESFKYVGRSVGQIVAEAWPASLELGGLTLLCAFAFGVPLGLLSAFRVRTWLDRVITLGAVTSVALPGFMVGPLLVMVFSFGIPFSWLEGLLPPALWDSPVHYILPVVTLALKPAAMIARLMRASALDVIRADFVRTARAKGVSEKAILFKHVLKNAFIPVLSISGPMIAGVLSGSFIVETIFAIPGLGKHFVQGILSRDYPVVMALTLVFAVMLIAVNLAIDLAFLALDPRLRDEEAA